MNILGLLLKDKWCIDKGYQSVQDIEQHIPEIYNKVMDGSYDAIFSRYNFKDKSKKMVIPQQFLNHFIRLTTQIDMPNITNLFTDEVQKADPNENAAKLLALFKKNTWEKCRLIKIDNTSHLVIKGTLNDADILRSVTIAPDLIYMNYYKAHDEMVKEELYQDFSRLAYQIPGGKLNDSACVLFSLSSLVRDNCKKHLKDDMKLLNMINAQHIIRSPDPYHDEFFDFILAFPNDRQLAKKHIHRFFLFDSAPNEIVKSNGSIVDDRQMPLDLDSYLIQILTRRDSLILSVFAGVGTTASAAAMCGRHSISFEPDEEKYEALVQRLYATKNIVEDDVFAEPVATTLRVMNENEYRKAIETEIKRHLLLLQKKEHDKKCMRDNVDNDMEKSQKRPNCSSSYPTENECTSVQSTISETEDSCGSETRMELENSVVCNTNEENLTDSSKRRD